MKYTVILEKGETSYGAFVPDIPGCIAVGESKEETLVLINSTVISSYIIIFYNFMDKRRQIRYRQSH